MKIVCSYPPNYEAIKAALTPSEHTCFTYGDTLYAPSLKEGETPAPHLLVHEMVHVEQQGDDPAGWWEKYLADPEFRLHEELEAYGAQFAHIEAIETPEKNRLPARVRKNMLENLAHDLSSPVYGGILSWSEAISKIRNAAKAVVQ